MTIRKSKTWTPLEESYYIENGFNAESSDDIRAFVLVTSMINDQDLTAFIRAVN